MEPNIPHARWWPYWCQKCASGLRRLEKIWTRWDAYMCWTLCSNVVQTQMREIGYNSFSPHCVCKNSCILNWDELFSSVGQFLGWSYLVLHFYGNVCYWIPKLFWPRLDWFGFFVGISLISSSSCLYGLKSAIIAHLCFSFDDMKSFR